MGAGLVLLRGRAVRLRLPPAARRTVVAVLVLLLALNRTSELFAATRLTHVLTSAFHRLSVPVSRARLRRIVEGSGSGPMPFQHRVDE